jgi:hypothetical protein
MRLTRKPVTSSIPGLRLADGGDAGGAQRVGLPPGPRGVDHRPGQQLLLPVGRLHAHRERQILTAVAADLVDTLAGDRRHPMLQVHVAGEGG